MRRAAPADVTYVTSLAKRLTDEIGFIPRGAVEEKVGLGRFWLVTENGDPSGFVYHGSLARPVVRIFQAAVQFDARRRKAGLALVAAVAARATAAGAASLSLRCLSQLDANDFWKAAGFTIAGTSPGGVSRGDTINVWTMPLAAASLPVPFTEERSK